MLLGAMLTKTMVYQFHLTKIEQNLFQVMFVMSYIIRAEVEVNSQGCIGKEVAKLKKREVLQ